MIKVIVIYIFSCVVIGNAVECFFESLGLLSSCNGYCTATLSGGRWERGCEFDGPWAVNCSSLTSLSPASYKGITPAHEMWCCGVDGCNFDLSNATQVVLNSSTDNTNNNVTCIMSCTGPMCSTSYNTTLQCSWCSVQKLSMNTPEGEPQSWLHSCGLDHFINCTSRSETSDLVQPNPSLPWWCCNSHRCNVLPHQWDPTALAPIDLPPILRESSACRSIVSPIILFIILIVI